MIAIVSNEIKVELSEDFTISVDVGNANKTEKYGEEIFIEMDTTIPPLPGKHVFLKC